MHHYLILFLCIIFVFSGGVEVLAYDSNDLSPSFFMEWGCVDFKRLEVNFGELRPISGEIHAISSELVVLKSRSRIIRCHLESSPLIWVNGRPGRLEALRPVAENCYFSARLWIDGDGHVRAIEGFYRGAEVELVEVEPLTTERYRVLVHGIAMETPIRAFETADDCIGVEELQGDIQGTVYLLFNLKGEIKGIYR